MVGLTRNLPDFAEVKGQQHVKRAIEGAGSGVEQYLIFGLFLS
jgi:predicted ATPase with chaperone activity